jgi:hypothetical protein
LIFVNLIKKNEHPTGKIKSGFLRLAIQICWVKSGGRMDFLTSFVSNVNWEAIVQLTFVALIMLSGPIVIFLLAARGGDM